MSLFNIFNVAGSAMSAQSQRLNAVASNIANVDSTTSADGQPYRAKQVVFKETPFAGSISSGVKVDRVVEDQSPPKKMYDPKHPQADEAGYVSMPNVSLADEMVDMTYVSQLYNANITAFNTVKKMAQDTLSIQ